ncbi:MAG TPA: heme ABC transporter substrate-binding protein IsdE [Candidatus Merdenecus merdavium]|nr:heme ABC transporter substrate-binding protein IsdE [Candidatus Merdenecus merdavium]
MLLLLVGCVDQSGASSEGGLESSDTKEIGSLQDETSGTKKESLDESENERIEKEEDSHAQEEMKIITTSVVICQILDQLNIDSVVGIPKSDTYEIPERYQEATVVGTPMAPDMEILSSLEADYILTPKSLEGTLRKEYETIDLPSYFADLSSTEGLYQSIEEMGNLFHREVEAKKLIDDYHTYIEGFQNTHSQEEPPRILILMGLPGSYVVATEQSYAGSLVKLAGGKNVYDDEKVEPFLNINPEDMVKRDPDMILLTSHAMPEQVEKMFEDEFLNNDIWSYFRAVENGQVYTLSHTRFGMSANFLYQEALEELEGILYQ